MGARGGRSRRRRDSAHVDRSRRNAQGVRLPLDGRRVGGGSDTRHRLRRRWLARTFCRGLHRWARRCGAGGVDFSFFGAQRAEAEGDAARPENSRAASKYEPQRTQRKYKEEYEKELFVFSLYFLRVLCGEMFLSRE